MPETSQQIGMLSQTTNPSTMDAVNLSVTQSRLREITADIPKFNGDERVFSRFVNAINEAQAQLCPGEEVRFLNLVLHKIRGAARADVTGREFKTVSDFLKHLRKRYAPVRGLHVLRIEISRHQIRKDESVRDYIKRTIKLHYRAKNAFHEKYGTSTSGDEELGKMTLENFLFGLPQDLRLLAGDNFETLDDAIDKVMELERNRSGLLKARNLRYRDIDTTEVSEDSEDSDYDLRKKRVSRREQAYPNSPSPHNRRRNSRHRHKRESSVSDISSSDEEQAYHHHSRTYSATTEENNYNRSPLASRRETYLGNEERRYRRPQTFNTTNGSNNSNYRRTPPAESREVCSGDEKREYYHPRILNATYKNNGDNYRRLPPTPPREDYPRRERPPQYNHGIQDHGYEQFNPQWYCWKCGKKGHDGETCQDRRSNTPSPSDIPFMEDGEERASRHRVYSALIISNRRKYTSSSSGTSSSRDRRSSPQKRELSRNKCLYSNFSERSHHSTAHHLYDENASLLSHAESLLSSADNADFSSYQDTRDALDEPKPFNQISKSRRTKPAEHRYLNTSAPARASVASKPAFYVSKENKKFQGKSTPAHYNRKILDPEDTFSFIDAHWESSTKKNQELSTPLSILKRQDKNLPPDNFMKSVNSPSSFTEDDTDSLTLEELFSEKQSNVNRTENTVCHEEDADTDDSMDNFLFTENIVCHEEDTDTDDSMDDFHFAKSKHQDWKLSIGKYKPLQGRPTVHEDWIVQHTPHSEHPNPKTNFYTEDETDSLALNELFSETHPTHIMQHYEEDTEAQESMGNPLSSESTTIRRYGELPTAVDKLPQEGFTIQQEREELITADLELPPIKTNVYLVLSRTASLTSENPERETDRKNERSEFTNDHNIHPATDRMNYPTIVNSPGPLQNRPTHPSQTKPHKQYVERYPSFSRHRINSFRQRNICKSITPKQKATKLRRPGVANKTTTSRQEFHHHTPRKRNYEHTTTTLST